MAPTHMAPFCSERIVLVEEVVLAFVVDETVRVISPVLRRREMKLKAVRLVVLGSGRENAGDRQNRQMFEHSIHGREFRAERECWQWRIRCIVKKT